MRLPAVLGLLFAALIATRFCHIDLLWIEECYPAAGALQILDGKIPYRDFWFDKPPLSPLVYLLWGAHEGWPLRLAGAVFVTLLSAVLYLFGRRKWGEREGMLAAGLIAFFLTFGIPSAVMALAPDLLMILPHGAAVYLAWRGRPFWAGLCAGIAALLHTKGVFVLAACLLWQYRAVGPLLGGFVLPNAAALLALAGLGALRDYYEQVWQWGMIYSRDTFVGSPAWEALRRTLNWMGFHATLVLAAAWFWWRERDSDSRRLAMWAAVSLVAVAAGWRFFPRYYFQLLPVMALVGARGLVLLGARRAAIVGLLLLLPVVRFGPRYATLAAWSHAGWSRPIISNIPNRRCSVRRRRRRRPMRPRASPTARRTVWHDFTAQSWIS